MNTLDAIYLITAALGIVAVTVTAWPTARATGEA